MGVLKPPSSPLRAVSWRRRRALMFAAVATMLYVSLLGRATSRALWWLFTGPEVVLTPAARRALYANNADINQRLPNTTQKLISLPNGQVCRIPKLLHQTYKTRNSSLWPVKEWTRWRESWREKQPETDGWRHMLWTDEENRRLVETFYPEYIQRYDSISLGVSRADLVRLLYMHLFGGVYADLDMASSAPLHVFFQQHEQACMRGGVVVGHMGEADATDSVPNAFLMSEPGHPLWRFCIESAPTRAVAVEARYGPIHIKRCIKAFTENSLDSQTRREGGMLTDAVPSHGGVYLASSRYFYPYSWVESEESMPSCSIYRTALNGKEFVDDDVRLGCERELRERSQERSAALNHTAPITYTVWCHSWGQLMERSSATFKLTSLLKRIHPRLGHL